MRTLLFLLLCLCISLFTNAQIPTQKITGTALPKNITYLGKPVQAIQYKDNTGTYLALATQTGAQLQKGEDEFKQAHLYGYLYQLKPSEVPVLIWKLHDLVTDCNLDMKADFIPGSLTVTDLDKNGKAEVWIAYRLACAGDISPSELKIIMHEGNTKYAIRGVGKIKIMNRLQPDGGEITSNDFQKGPAAFKQYSGKLWNKYVLEVLK